MTKYEEIYKINNSIELLYLKLDINPELKEIEQKIEELEDKLSEIANEP